MTDNQEREGPRVVPESAPKDVPEGDTSAMGTEVATAVQDAGRALLSLGDAGHHETAVTLARLVAVVADEASRTPRFARALARALPPAPADEAGAGPRREQGLRASRRTGRRAPGPFDPFAVYGANGEDGLRQRLGALDLEQLRDIVAEHGMDHDRLAMKWKDPERVIGRIVERVMARAAKGSAFRDPR